MGFPFHRRENNPSVGITEAGRQYAQNTGFAGPPFLILAALAEHSPKSINSLEKETRLNRRILTVYLNQLASQGFITSGMAGGV